MATAAMLAGNLKKMKKVTCGHRIPAPVSGKYNRKNGPFRFPDGHKVPSELGAKGSESRTIFGSLFEMIRKEA